MRLRYGHTDMTEPTIVNSPGHLPLLPSGSDGPGARGTANASKAMTPGRPTSGLITAGLLSMYSLLVGNPLSTRALFDVTDLRRSYLSSVVLTYTKVSIPGGQRRGIGPNFMAPFYWPGTEGPRALRTFSVSGEQPAHWLAQDVRTVLMIALGGLFVHLALRAGRAGGFGGRAFSSWGALMVAGVMSGVLSNGVFLAAGGRTMYQSTIDSLMTGAGIGAMFSAFVCWPLALIAAAVHRTHR
jgi:hypothetical protein